VKTVRAQALSFIPIALVSASALLYQIAVTRLLSVVFWYHFAFLSVSIAMLGIGAPGAWLARRPPSPKLLPRLLVFAALTIPLSVVVLVKARTFLFALGLGDDAWMGSAMLAMLLPMCALGAAVCVLLMSAPGAAVASMYSADLLGAMAGAVLVIPLLSTIDTPRVIAAIGLLPLLALAVQAGFLKPASWLVPALALLASLAWATPYTVRYSKTYDEEGQSKPLLERWTATARITLFERPIHSPRPDVPWGWGYGARFQPRPHEQRWLDQDGSAGTPIERLPGRPEDLSHLLFDVTSAAHQIMAPQSVCILGAGGGRDIVTALATGARSVDAVEINGAIFDLMTGPMAAFSGDIYRRPGVRAVRSEGRSYLTRTDRRYDLIQISLVDTWTATAAGAYALSENYLYTVEALRMYLARLRPGGVLSISRWTDSVQPFESARLMLLAEAALAAEGAAAPREHMVLLNGGWIGNLIIGKEPLTANARERADHVAHERGFVRQWPPVPGQPPSLVGAVMQVGAERFAGAGFDLAPPVDDRPFFFQASHLFRFGDDPTSIAPTDPNLESIALLRLLLALLTGAVLILFFTPFVLMKKRERSAGLWRGSGYFALIGVGFMLLEVPFIQASILFVGHPSNAAAIVLAALLAGAGLGARLAGRMPASLTRRLIWLAPIVCAGVSLAMGPVFRSALGLPLALRVGLLVPLVALAGTGLGLLLPFGFMQFDERDKPWFWAINGAAGVLAGALSIALAISFGFLATSLVGASCYVLAAALLAYDEHRRRAKA
jgi:hypothetical protein